MTDEEGETMARGTTDIVPTTLDEVEAALTDPTAKLTVVAEEDAEEVGRRIVASILTAENPLARVKSVGGRDLLGVPLRVSAVDWRNSDLDGEGLGIFAVLHATKQDGTEVAVTCGGRNVLAQLYRVVRDGLLPVDVMFTESKPTAKGRTVLWLEESKWEAGGF